ncbi:MAG TPA: AAA family ATPase [Vicinamibacterales bacterium]|nr:AAA family ATPase [Vicinamibacterales bacterium]
MQPPASLEALGDPIYEAFYGLTEQPFAITTDPKFFFLSASHQRAFSELLNGLRRREGLLLLTGETGSGKTTMCRAVLEALGERTFSALILNPYMSGAEVLRIVLRDFGLVTHEELRRGALATADVAQLLDTLEGFLQSLVPLGSHAVIVLDEAQSLSPPVLDQIRLLTALEQQGQRLVQVVLCGQPGILRTLESESMYALNERITRRVALTPLPAEEVRAYIDHRLAVAGGADAVHFDPAAARLIFNLAHGLPRRVNVLCDRALQEGRIEGVNVITPELVKRAARSLAGAHDPTLVAPSEPVPVPASAPAAPPVVATPSAAPASSTVAAPSFLTDLSETDDASPAPTRRWLAIAAGLAIVAAAVGGGYGYYAHGERSSATAARVPAPPARNLGEPAVPLATPPPDEFARVMETATPRAVGPMTSALDATSQSDSLTPSAAPPVDTNATTAGPAAPASQSRPAAVTPAPSTQPSSASPANDATPPAAEPPASTPRQ